MEGDRATEIHRNHKSSRCEINARGDDQTRGRDDHGQRRRRRVSREAFRRTQQQRKETRNLIARASVSKERAESWSWLRGWASRRPGAATRGHNPGSRREGSREVGRACVRACDRACDEGSHHPPPSSMRTYERTSERANGRTRGLTKRRKRDRSQAARAP